MDTVFLRKLHLQIASEQSPVVVVNELGQILSFNNAAYRCGAREAGIDLWDLIGESHVRLLNTSLATALYEIKTNGCAKLSAEGSSSDSSVTLDKMADPVNAEFLCGSNDNIKAASSAGAPQDDDVNLENVLFA